MSPGIVSFRLRLASVLVVLLSSALTLSGQSGAKNGEWRAWGGDLAMTRYAPLDQINAGNFNKLEVAWRFKTENLGRNPDFNLQATPLMVNGVLYFTAGAHRNAVAVDAATGEMLWMHRLEEGKRAEASSRRLSGRGVGYWTDGRGDERIFYVSTGYQLVGLDAKTGDPLRGFGTNGVVDLKQDNDQLLDPITSDVAWNGAPVVAKDVVLVGAAHRAGGAPRSRENAKGYIRGFDARTGKRLWIFHTIPQPGEFGNETWLKDSWSYTGHTGVWGQMTVDEELGIAYLPIEMPTGDYFGGHRPGNNLFAESLVAVDLQTGKRIWHFQLVHHPIWDYDIPCAPILADITVDGKKIKAVAQPTKQGFVYVFDRQTGQPVWPIEERPVEQGDGADRMVLADAAVPDQAAALRAAGLPARGRDRLHAGAEGGSAEDRVAVQDRSALHAADHPGSRRQDRHVDGAKRRELAWRVVRSRDRHPLRLLAHAAPGALARERSEAVGHELHQRRRRRRGWRRRWNDRPGTAAGETAMGTDHGDRSQQGRDRVAGRSRRDAGLRPQSPGAQGRQHSEDGPDRRRRRKLGRHRHARDEDAGDVRRGRHVHHSRPDSAARCCAPTTRPQARTSAKCTCPVPRPAGR